jgi:hypothetical protein
MKAGPVIIGTRLDEIAYQSKAIMLCVFGG